MARRVWPGEDPVGAQVHVGGPAEPPLTVVGVVAALFGATAALTSYVPARRAMRVEPMAALHDE